jgi:hypothetical protein
MKLARTGWSWITTAVVTLVAVCLVPAQVSAWTHEYWDDFSSTDKVEKDSYLHSIFWPRGAFPPSEPYLYHSDTGELGFGEFDDPAVLGYAFPVDSADSPGAVSGTVSLDIRFTDSVSGFLQYEVSEDGVDWSSTRNLGQGSQSVSLESISGVCYIRFIGTEVLIDNLSVSLRSPLSTIRVPNDYTTIQDAIDAASNGDIIEVSPDTYRGEGNRDIDFKKKAITLRSSSGASRTIIDCQGHRGFYFHQGEGRKSVLRGFTIRGASLEGSDFPTLNSSWPPSPDYPVGGGIYCENSSPSIIDCVIERCKAELGGGICVVNGSPFIFSCTIERCEAGGFGTAQTGGYGAGIAVVKGSDAHIVNCPIESNTAYNQSLGAGVYCQSSKVMLSGCGISYNDARVNVRGGGLYCGGSSAHATLKNCIVSHNTAESGGGIFSESNSHTNITNCTIADNTGGGVHANTSYTAIRNSIVWYNNGTSVVLDHSLSSNPVAYSNIEGSYSGQGNISSEPMFVSNESDYHLRSYWDNESFSFSNHSPCIDAGDPQDPIGAEPFPNNKRINMGAYGGTPEASESSGPVILHVNVSGGSDNNTGMSKDQAFRTIQKAVEFAEDGDFIMVWPGIYREAVWVNRKAVTIQSADDAAVVIAPFGDPIAFTFQFAESSRSVLRNFVIADCGEAAVYCNGASPELTNLTIVNNNSGINAYGGSVPRIANCIFWNNEHGDLEQCYARYSRISSLEADDTSFGNIDDDPRFAGAEDFHLRSEYGRYVLNSRSWTTDSLTSPCIDAGDPAMRVGREQKPNGARVNMGAYGGTPFASKSGPSW